MQRDHAGPFGPLLQQQLVPGLGLRADVDEHQRRGGALDLGDDRHLHLLAEMAAPREPARVIGQQRVDRQRLLDPCRAPACRASWPSSTCIASGRLPSVALRPQTTRPGFQRLQARQGELHLHAALVAHQFVPLVDDDGMDAASVRPAACSRVSIRLSDSGVVTSTVGNRRSWRARSAGGVSPVRMPTRQPGAELGERGLQRPGRCRPPGRASASARGRRAAARAAARSRHAERRGAGDARRTRPHRSCPDPVVACSRPLRPAAIARQTSRWNSNGCQPRLANQASAGGSDRHAAGRSLGTGLQETAFAGSGRHGQADAGDAAFMAADDAEVGAVPVDAVAFDGVARQVVGEPVAQT